MHFMEDYKTLIKLTIKNYGLVIRSYFLGIYKLDIDSRLSKIFDLDTVQLRCETVSFLSILHANMM